MEKLTEKLEALNQEMIQRILFLLEEKGVESKFSTKKVLSIKDEQQMHNIEYGRWLVEITADELIDNEGYEYSLHNLGFEELCKVVDSLS